MDDLLNRLDTFNCYAEDSDAKQLRKDAADEIRSLRRQVSELEALIRRRSSEKMSRRAA
ncbi:hypothetical protein [Cupriavidus pinatubonensis]|uniref:hypothetical protein n=1 Tax=Cupriavidus pinatubonensis TaxID=248026 RepID=UPI0036177FC3